MIAVLDVHYIDTKAHAAAVVFADWQSEEQLTSHRAIEEPVAEYEPGKFYMRELSPLLKVIMQLDPKVHTYVIDGYCHLSQDFAPGLGAYLHASLAQPVTIVGVAKNRYRDSEHAVEVFRANSKRPLFVTAIGIEYKLAGEHVHSMAGQFRIPKMLKAVDRHSRNAIGG